MGKFFTPLDTALGSAAKVRLVRELARLPSGISGREAALLARLSLSGAQHALRDLEAVGVVRRESTRSQHLYSLNRGSLLVREGLVPLFAAEAARVDEVYRRVRTMLAPARGAKALGVKAAVVFGSAARGADRPGSDFDLLVVVDRPGRADAVHRLVSDASPMFADELGLALSPVVLTLDRLRAMRAGGDAFPEEVIRDGRTILGPSIGELLGGGGGTAEAGRPVAGRKVSPGWKRAPRKRPRAHGAGDG
jgi:predicted nucleotidyltransferase